MASDEEQKWKYLGHFVARLETVKKKPGKKKNWKKPEKNKPEKSRKKK